MALQIGQLIAGKYRIDQLLGEGGMGSVYVAENIVLRKKVAVKVMSPAFTKIPEAVERFLREGVAASRVSHPAIVEVFDAGEQEGQPWMAMQLLRGESLGERLDRVHKLPVEDVKIIARGVLSALAAVHAEGIVHRDLKPDNIFLHEEGDGRVQPKVLDFGIAKDTNDQALNKLTATGAVVGTASYLSPEQAKGTAIDHRTDIYSIGVVLFECLSGSLPYEAGTLTQLIAKMFTESPRRLSEVAPEVPKDIAEVISTCLAHEPSERYQSAGELLVALLGEAAGLSLTGVGSGAGVSQPGSLSHPGSSSQPGSLSLSGSSSQPGSPSSSPQGPAPGLMPTALGPSPASGSLPRTSARGTQALGGSSPEEGAEEAVPASIEAPPPRPSRMGWVVAAGLFMAVGTGAAVLAAMLLLREPEGAQASAAVAATGEDGHTAVATTEPASGEGSEAPSSAGSTEEAAEASPEAAAEGGRAPAEQATADEDGDRGRRAHRDRRRRGEREQSGGGSPAGGSSTSASGGGEAPRLGLTSTEIGAIVRHHVPQFQSCHSQRARAGVSLRGQITLSWHIRPDGSVSNAQVPQSTIGDSELQRCVLGVVRGMRFPPPRGGVTVPARYPIAFQ